MTPVPGSASPRLRRLLSEASVELSSRATETAELSANFAPGTEVTITFLPGDDYRRNLAVAESVSRAGFRPVPHIAARELASRDGLDDLLARAVADAGVARVLLVAGDAARRRGPFASSLDVLRTDLLQRHGIGSLSVAGHPEGHPHVEPDAGFRALQEKVVWARDAGIAIEATTQFCFGARPILDWMAALDERNITLPVRVGLAGPASPALLLKFALRCGVGNSLSSLRNQIGRFGRLLADAGPDEVVSQLMAAPFPAVRRIVGFHFFPFGGLPKTADWLRAEMKQPAVARVDGSARIGQAMRPAIEEGA